MSEKLRTIKQQVEQSSVIVEQIVDQIVAKYNRDLDDLMIEVKGKLDLKNDLSDEELEAITLKLPVFMYFSAGGIETLGVECDTAKAVKASIFNKKYLDYEGTIQDKTKNAELLTLNEAIIEVAFQRAYKRLKVQLDMAEHVFSGVRKVLSKRIGETELSRRV